MRTTGRVRKREEKAFSPSMLFVLIPLYKPCEKSLLYPMDKKLPTGQKMQKCKHTKIGQTMSNESATSRKVSEIATKNTSENEISAAIQGIRTRLETLASINAENILIPGGPQER